MSHIKENLTKEEQQARFEEAKVSTDYLVKDAQKRGYNQAVDTAKNVLANLEKIELKERCLRVKFLDWFSDKLLAWSKSVHKMSVNIDSPCSIKLPEKKQEQKSTNGIVLKMRNSKIIGVKP